MSNPTDQTTAAPVQFQYVATDSGAQIISFPAPKRVPAEEVGKDAPAPAACQQPEA